MPSLLLNSALGTWVHANSGSSPAYPCITQKFETLTSPAPGNAFAELLKRGRLSEAYSLLNRNLAQVRAEMEALPGREKSQIARHWAGANTGYVISTPIEALVEISKQMKFQKGQTMIDLGSGHGDPAIVLGALNPEMKILGYDLVKPKVDGATRTATNLGLNNVHFKTQDFSDPHFQLPSSDYYYLFNPAKPEIVESLARQIKAHSQKKKIQVIVYGSGWTPKIFHKEGFKVVKNDALARQRVTVFEFERPIEKAASKSFDLEKLLGESLITHSSELNELRTSEKTSQQISDILYEIEMSVYSRRHLTDSSAIRAANTRIVRLTKKLLESYGYKTGEIKTAPNDNMTFFEVLEGPPGTQTSQVIARMREQGTPVLFGLISQIASRGAALNHGQALLLSPRHVQLGEEFLSTTLLHEARHIMHFRNIRAGKGSPYDAVITSSSGAPITALKGYSVRLSFQELSTFKKDARLLETQVPTIGNVDRKTLRSEKIEEAKQIAFEVINASDHILFLLDHDPEISRSIRRFASENSNLNGAIEVRLPYTASTGNHAILKVWLPELKPASLNSVTDEKLLSVLTQKLETMKSNAFDSLDELEHLPH